MGIGQVGQDGVHVAQLVMVGFDHAGAAAPIPRRPMVESDVVEEAQKLSCATDTAVKQQVWAELIMCDDSVVVSEPYFKVLVVC